MHSLLYGHNPEERIVALEQFNDQQIRLFIRNEGKILQKDVEFFPFFFLSDDSLIKDFPKKFWLKKLEGNNFYRFIVAFQKWSEMWDAIHFIFQQHNKRNVHRVTTYLDLKEILVRPDPIRQYLLQSGTNLFNGMEYEDLVILNIDVQFSLSTSKKLPFGHQQILVVTLLTNNEEYSIKFTSRTEKKNLIKLLKLIEEIDPDFIIGENLYDNILPRLIEAYNKYNIPFTLGRNKTEVSKQSPFIRAIKEANYYQYNIYGRYIIDIFDLVDEGLNQRRTRQYRNIYGLAKQLDIKYDNNLILQDGEITEEWKNNPNRIINYSKQNAHVISEISNAYLPFLVDLCKICPFDIRLLMKVSSNARIESLILREYVKQKHSIPRWSESARTIGIPTEVFFTGVFKDVYYIELDELYSSIIINHNISPKKDILNVFNSLVSEVRTLYHQFKDIDITKDSKSQFKVIKYLLDSFHHYLGYSRGLFSDSEQAEILTDITRKVFKEIIQQINLFNANVIQTDGNGLFIQMPDNVLGEASRKEFIDRLSRSLPFGIKLIIKNYFSRMLSYKRGNYALLDSNNNIFIKGNSIYPQGMEKYLRIFTQRIIECLLTEDFKLLHHIYASIYTQITQHKWTVYDFCRTEVVKMDIETYQRELLTGKISPSPAMEAALRSSLFVKSEDIVSYYITGSEANIDINSHSKIAEEWNSSLPDENTAYYLNRFQETINRFNDLIENSALSRICSLDDIFGFTDEGIKIINRQISSDLTMSKLEPEDHFGIWLDIQ